MHKKKLRFFIAAVALSLSLQPVLSAIQTIDVYAASAAYLPESLTTSYLQKATEMLSDIENSFNQASTGQAGLLSKLDDIQRYAMVLYYLDKYRSHLSINGVEISNSEINEYTERFVAMCSQFDSAFGETKTQSSNTESSTSPEELGNSTEVSSTSQFISLKLGITEKSVKTDEKLRKCIKKLCEKTVPEYVSSVLQGVTDKTTSMSSSEILSKHGILLSSVVMLLDDADDISDDLTNISPYKKQSSSVQVDFDTCIDLPSATAEIRKNFSKLLEIGEEVSTLVGSDAVISIDTSKGFVSNMANVTENNGNVVIPDGVQLSQAYLAILAAGATYVPFHSYAGESSFKTALKSLVADEAVVDPLVEFYDDTKSFRKPLYKRVLSNTGTPTGKAKLITVNEFLEDIKSGAEGALVTIGGKFTYDTKNNYWVYADTYSTNQDEDKLDTPTDSQDFSENVDDTLENAVVTEEQAEEAIEEKEEQGGSSTENNIKISIGASPVEDGVAKGLVITLSNGTTSASYAFSYKKDGLVKYITLKTIYNKSDGSPEVYEFYTICDKNYTYRKTAKFGEEKLNIPEAYKLSLVSDDTLKYFLDTDIRGSKVKLRNGKKVVAPYAVYTSFFEYYKDSKGETGISEDNGINADDILKFKEGTFTISSANSNDSMLAKEDSDLFVLTANATTVTDDGSGGGGGTSIDDTNSSESGGADTSSGETSSEESSSNESGDTAEDTAEDTAKDPTADPAEDPTADPAENPYDDSNDSDSDESSDEGPSLTQTTQTTINTNEVSGMSVAATDVPGIMADKNITSEDKMSEPILLYGAKHARGTDNLTTMIFRNIIAGTVDIDGMYEESNDYLYVNPYGDILTDDGLVILPGIANPIMYKSSAKYNPYTAAFMNYYPTVLENTNFFQVASKNDIGKMLILNDSAESLEDGSLDPESLVTNKATTISSICDVKATAPVSVPEMETTFIYNNVQEEELLGYTRLIFGDSSTWSKDGTGMYAYTPLLIKAQMSCDGVPIFPYNVDDDRDAKDSDSSGSVVKSESYHAAEIIAQNMFHYLTTDSTQKVSNLGTLNDNYIVYYFCISNLNGTSNPLAYANADTYAYERYTDDASIRKESTLLQVSNKIVDSLSSADQIIGIKAATQDSILGPAFAFIKENWLMCFMILIVVLLFGFARIQRDAFQSIILLILSVVFAYSFVYIIPNYLPLAFNSFINNVSEDLAYKIMAVKAESNSIDKTDLVALDEDGNYKFDTASLNLYRVSSGKLDDFYSGLGITESDVVGGKTHLLNQEAGLFVEGNTIKINTDVLFNTLEITGSFDADSTSYYLESTKTVSNSMDYYTPYYQFVDCFIGKLNDLTSIYQIPRTMTKYSDDVIKDNYLVYSYVNSLPFLTPGIYDAYEPEDQAILSSEQLQYLLENQEAVAKQLEATFGDEDTAKDWLGISYFFYDLDPDYRNTVWAQTMYDNGYYKYDTKTKTDWVPNEEKINDLCNYVNTQTKKFVFSMDDQIGSLSDDVMIKIITLRELTAFTQYVSEMGHWLYPFSLNYAEMTMKDVLSCAFVNDYYSFVGCDMNICEYILVKYGWFHLILFDALVVFLFIVSTIVHYAVPLMYLLLGILLLIKIISNQDIKIPLKGYFKCTLITMLCSTALCAAIVMTNRFNNSVISLYFLIAALLLITSILVTIVTSLITNLADFGNTSINAKAEGVKNRFSKVGYNTSITNVITRNSRSVKPNKRTVIDNSIATKYSTDRSVDDFYDDNIDGTSISVAEDGFNPADYDNEPVIIENGSLDDDEFANTGFDSYYDDEIR